MQNTTLITPKQRVTPQKLPRHGNHIAQKHSSSRDALSIVARNQ
jgi:hypothetical protein